MRRRLRLVDGILVLNKPLRLSSNAALQRSKLIYAATKGGHTGSLDPLATGVLPICFGEAAKLSQFLLDADKTYVTTIQLGVTTDTGDAGGQAIQTASAAAVSAERIDEVLARFRGSVQQVPPMYSALRHEGVRLYSLARRGRVVPREARTICIYSLERLDFVPGEQARLTLRLDCSKGTYVRVLAEDLGAALGCGAHVASLHRSRVGLFSDVNAVSVAQLEAMRGAPTFTARDALLLQPAVAVMHLPELRLDDVECRALAQGKRVSVSEARTGLVRATDDRGELCGVAELLGNGQLAPRRMMAAWAHRCD